MTSIGQLSRARLAGRPADYAALGLGRAVAVWEDGFRTAPGGPGTWEWWYFEARLDDGSTLVIVFYTKDFTEGGAGPPRPFVTLELDRPDGTRVSERATAHCGDHDFATGRCAVRIGASTFTGDHRGYRVHAELDGVTADVVLTPRTEPWRPETGHIYFGEDDERFFAWLPSVPSGSAEVTLAVGGRAERRAGTGYHDHNWGDTPVTGLIDHWYWARAAAGPYNVIASHITSEERYDRAEFPIFMLARGNRIVADDCTLVRFAAYDEDDDPGTGRPVAGTLVFEYRAADPGDDGYRVTFTREDTTPGAPRAADLGELDEIGGFRNALAKIAGFDGSYLRFTGEVQIERMHGGQPAETHTAAALWELVYPGRTPGSIS
ncbi:hypothetical protein [Actinomadura xylanilytica]|uniref:hypothetical protein n=1 Tax=Actinomadura xylanilytica TaxID=887459 RepID=UPI00255AC6E1|nr:hypothetical protein [Actinomadura xylanilytica]MDL4773565.1 hypothetical protein [Actinomadura xylanilytica]